MTPRSARRALADSQGQSLVEFSLSALMLMLLIFGVFEMSRLLLVYTTVANAARAGERYAIVHGEDQTVPVSQIQTVVMNYLSAAPMNTANATTTVTYPDPFPCGPTSATSPPGCHVKVSIVYPYDPFVSFYSRFFSINVSSTSEGVITW